MYSRCTEVEAVVLANGEYPTASLPLHILESAPYVVCCDGGADEYIRQGHIPNLIIGDGDSICEENRRKYGHLLHCFSRPDSSHPGSGDQRPDQSRQLLIVTRETPDSHRRRHRQTRRPYFGKYQPAYGLHACRSRCMYLYRLWRFHPLPGHVYPPLPAGAAGIYHQLRRPQAAWNRTGISPQRLHQLVARHSQRMYRH